MNPEQNFSKKFWIRESKPININLLATKIVFDKQSWKWLQLKIFRINSTPRWVFETNWAIRWFKVVGKMKVIWQGNYDRYFHNLWFDWINNQSHKLIKII